MKIFYQKSHNELKHLELANTYMVTLISPDHENWAGINMDTDIPILDSALDYGIDLPYSCRTGACSTCTGRIIYGEVDQEEASFLSDEQKRNGFVMCCISKVGLSDKNSPGRKTIKVTQLIYVVMKRLRTRIFQLLLCVICVFTISGIKAQPITDYLSYNYKYLDKDYRIKIPPKIFEQGMKKYKFLSDRIIKYSDSLSVVMMIEFGDWDKARIAVNRISHSWLRLGYHTWQTENEAKEFASHFNITHPWRMREFLCDEANTNNEVLRFFETLKKKIRETDNTKVLDGITRVKLLDIAMVLNPQRIKDFQAAQYKRRHGNVDPKLIGVGCSKPNCCQKK